MTTDSTDQIICILEYPESGDQASVIFVNYTTLQTDQLSGCRRYAKLIAKALRDSDKMTSGPCEDGFAFGNEDVDPHVVTPPCLVTEQITIYFE